MSSWFTYYITSDNEIILQMNGQLNQHSIQHTVYFDKYTTGLATSLVYGMGAFQDEQPLFQMLFDHETGANRLQAWNEPSMSRESLFSIICLR